MKTLLLIVVMFGLSGFARDSTPFADGNELHDECATAIVSSGYYEGGHCFGMIEAYLQLSSQLSPRYFPAHCIPEAVTFGQMAKVVVRYLDQHPEQLHLMATLVIAKATHDGFPCRATVKK